MEKKIATMQEGLLNERHQLYARLVVDNPDWWVIAKADPELYIDVRKDNKIDIYYRGGRMAGIELKRNGKISVTAHPKYVGYNGTDKDNPSVYRRRIDKKGKEVYNAIYQDCSSWMVNRMEELKKNIRDSYSGDDDGEETTEKYIQGKLVIDHRDLYIDTEFAHRFYEKERLTVRIDLIKIVNNKLTFVELKRIGDNRLLSRDGNPEILTQIDNYRKFIRHNKVTLLNYYKTLYKIKQYLGLPTPHVDDIEKMEIVLEPGLLIAKNYENLTTGKIRRIQEMERILKTISVVPDYI